MKDLKRVALFLLAVSMVATGCTKKINDQTSIAGTGFDSATATPATTNEELAQLPAASTTNQQTSVEALPVEASPVTQSASTIAPAISADGVSQATSSKLNHGQEIQTALKNAGFYNGKIDGKLGPASKKAIEEFQKQNGLKADGKVGPKTWTALSAHLNGAATSAPATTTPEATNQ